MTAEGSEFDVKVPPEGVETTKDTKNVSITEPSGEDNEKKHEHVKDYQTGISFSIHDNPLEHKKQACSFKNLTKLNPKYKLVAEEDALQWSMLSVRLSVLATACGLTILQPNFPFLVTPGATPYSFPSTDPFDFSGATYFLPMTSMVGTALTSIFMGSISDRYGRRPCFLFCMAASVVTLIIQYFCRGTFWGFCAASFVNGLFGSSIPVAMAYASDVHPSRAKKDEEIGLIIGFNMIGMSGGGAIAILMENEDLFYPLFVAAALDFAAFVFLYFFCIEPDKSVFFKGEDEEDEGEAPETIDKRLFTNVMAGALFDNIGSSGLFPLALAPLAFDAFLMDFVVAGRPQDIIMSETAYKWLSVGTAFMVIPGAAFSQPVFNRIGAAGGCVFGNVVTGIGIMACLLIVEIDPPSTATFVGFIAMLYGVFPMTVLSQLSTGPMLDMLSPVDRRGFTQGLNMTIMNFAMAVSPWCLGMIADNIGTPKTMWLCMGVSLFAALVNVPLMFAPELKRKEPVDYQQAMGLEDQEMVDKLLRGEWVPAKFVDDLNYSRFQKGLPFLRPPMLDYNQEKKDLKILRRHAKADFEYHRFLMHDILNDLAEPDGKKKNVELLKKVTPAPAEQDEMAEAMGRWFADYLKDSGYFLDGGWPPVYKAMIMQSFPPINTDGAITEDNVEQTVLGFLANMNIFLRDEGRSNFNKAFRNSVVV